MDLIVSGVIGLDITDIVVAEQLAAADPGAPVTVRISSYGGNPFAGLAIHNALVRHAAEITVIVDSVAASAASIIAMAGDKVVMEQGASMMIHRASTYAEGDAAEFRRMLQMLETTDQSMAAIYAGRTGRGDPDMWLAAMDATTWFTAPEAVEAGLADEALEVAPRSGAATATAGVPTVAELQAVHPLLFRGVDELTAAAEFLAHLPTEPDPDPDPDPAADTVSPYDHLLQVAAGLKSSPYDHLLQVAAGHKIKDES